MLEGVSSYDFHDRYIGPHEEAHEPHHADDGVLGCDQWWQILRVEGQNLQQWWEDESQETATDRAHQGNDQVQLRD